MKIIFLSFFFLLSLTQAGKTEEKEETCFVLSTRAVSNREAEWKEILKSKSSTTEQILRNKLIEDSFNHCMKKISPDEVKKFSGTKIRDYKTYSYLVDISYDKYKTNSKIVPNTKFDERKIEIAKRVAIKSMERSNDL